MKSPARQAVNRDIKHSMALLLQGDPSPQSSSPSQPHLSPLSSPDQRTHRQIEILNWRIKTSLPVVKPIHFTLLQNTHLDSRKTTLPDRPWVKKSSEKQVGRRSEQLKGHPGVHTQEKEAEGELQVQIEEIKWRLDDVGILSLPQILHLLKEMMVGFDVLVDIFGTFHPTARMVALNNHSQWKVWVHQNFAFNYKPPISHPPTHREFIYSLLCLTEQHCAMTNLARTFFSETKQLTFSEHCTFIKVIEKIKEFVTQHRIFMVSKFTLPIDKQERHHLNHEPQKDKSKNKRHMNVIKSPLKNFEKKDGFKNGHLLSPPHNRSFNLIGNQGTTSSISQFLNYRINHSHATSPNSRPSQCNLTIPSNFMSNFTSLRATGCSQLLNNSVQLKNVFSSRNLREQEQANNQQERLSAKKKLGMSTNLHVSPPPHLQRKMVSPTSNNPVLNKSRREIKAIINTPDPVITAAPVTPSNKSRKTQRKYSEQLFKARSLDMLQAKRAKFHGSNIFQQDPQTRQAVNIEVVKRHETIHTPSGKKTNQTSDKQGVGSPIDSSLSSKQLQNSQEREFTHKEPNYKNLKINDLNNGKARNNLSSCYGAVSQDEINKNMATSYSFKNRNQIKSESSNDQSSPDKKGQNNNNQWAKKISGLFSDDASIKHLKGSVKFKTRDEDLFEKEFLKDVKLDMLEQFGRKVRHSIVDEENDFDQRHNPFKEMQLIEEVFDDEGKSHIEKEDLIQDDDIPTRSIRSRHQTVQINNLIKEEEPAPVNIENKQCLSEYFESESQDCFNFESEMYVINPKS